MTKNTEKPYKITPALLRQWGVGYAAARIAELVPPEGLTPLDVLDLDVHPGDRLWVVLREDVIPARELRLLACKWAEGACRAAGWDDPRSLAAIETARRYASGEATQEELAAARGAAWDAAMAARDAARGALDAARGARDAAWYAARGARDAALGAARDAARDAALDAARDAAWGAAWAAWGAAWAARGAAWDAALDAAWAAHIDDVRSVLRGVAF